MTSKGYVVYTTTDDERKAHEIAETLWDRRRKAIVMEVRQMPDPPRTTDRFAVLAEKKK
jgi:DNA polymerase IIIc chi subunit